MWPVDNARLALCGALVPAVTIGFATAFPFVVATGNKTIAGEVHHAWLAALVVLAILTMTVGNVVAIVQNNVKRMLAYSSIAHAGYALVGFIAAGAAPTVDQRDAAIAAGLFFLLTFSFGPLHGTKKRPAFSGALFVHCADDALFDNNKVRITRADHPLRIDKAVHVNRDPAAVHEYEVRVPDQSEMVRTISLDEELFRMPPKTEHFGMTRSELFLVHRRRLTCVHVRLARAGTRARLSCAG